jgi:hypothetical protein
MKAQAAVIAVSLLALSGISSAQSGMGKLKVHASPSRAGVFVDGKYLGPAGNFGIARTYNLAPGQHEVTISEPRYQETKESVTITEGKTTSIRPVLQKLPPPQGPFGLLKTKNPPDKFAGVFLNGKYIGHVGEFDHGPQGARLPAGEYELRIVPPSGGREFTEKITITANQTTVVEVK